MPDMVGIGFVPDETMSTRLKATYAAAARITGRDIPFVSRQGAPASESCLVMMVRALAAAASWGEIGDRVALEGMANEPAWCMGVHRDYVSTAVREMPRLLVAWPEHRQVILEVLQVLFENDIEVVVPQAWREALDFAW